MSCVTVNAYAKINLSLDVVGKRADGKGFRLIPYYKWCRRTTGRPRDDRMAVWFRQENMKDTKTLENMIGGKLYEDYD